MRSNFADCARMVSSCPERDGMLFHLKKSSAFLPASVVRRPCKKRFLIACMRAFFANRERTLLSWFLRRMLVLSAVFLRESMICWSARRLLKEEFLLDYLQVSSALR